VNGGAERRRQSVTREIWANKTSEIVVGAKPILDKCYTNPR
jgi:hypothetical protein